MQPQPLAAAAVSTQPQQTDATPSIELTFARPGLPIPRFTLTIRQTGLGQYRGEQIEPTAPPDPQALPQPFDTTFAISPATTAKIFTLASHLNHFNIPCASPMKNIAATGAKTLRYLSSDGTDTSCTFDYSDNKDVEALTNILCAIAETMDQGRRLDFLHRYDRLGLDAAIAALANAASEQRALELATIAPSLRSIADDAEVMQRVRVRATKLLASIPPDAPQ
jgi:hypothetical protein